MLLVAVVVVVVVRAVGMVLIEGGAGPRSGGVGMQPGRVGFHFLLALKGKQTIFPGPEIKVRLFHFPPGRRHHLGTLHINLEKFMKKKK